jgi:hypothetical protein
VSKLKAAVALSLAAGCAVYDASLLTEGGAPDAGRVDASGDVDPCDHAEPPARPAADDPSDAGDLEVVVALSAVDFGGDGGVVGFDLDRTCTCPAPESCVPQNSTTTHCDDSQGRDNSGGALIQTFSALTTSLDPTKLDQHIGEGLYSLLLRVRSYNGTPNDSQVSVAAFSSNGTVPVDGGVNPMPKHDGTDQWGIDPSSVVGTPPPYVAAYEDDTAYVSGGVLVANVSFPFSIGTSFGANFLRLDGAYLVATITKTQTGYALAGVVTGRWDTRNLLTGMQAIKDPFNAGQFLCGADPTYGSFKAAICGAADIASESSSDNTGAPCNALSLALGFQAEPALLGGILDAGVRPTPCGANYSDKCGN